MPWFVKSTLSTAALGAFLLLGPVVRGADDMVTLPGGKHFAGGKVLSEDFMKITYERTLKKVGKQSYTWTTGEYEAVKYGDAPQSYTEALRLIRDEDYAGAADGMARAVADAKNVPLVHQAASYYLGLAQLRNGETDKAIGTLSKFTADYGNSRWIFQAYKALAAAYVEKGDTAGAEKIYKALDDKARELNASEKKITRDYGLAILREIKTSLSDMFMRTNQLSKAADLMREAEAEARAAGNYAGVNQAIRKQYEIFLTGEQYNDARGVLQRLTDVIDRPNSGGFSERASLYMENADPDTVGWALLRIGDSYRQESEKTGNPSLLRSAITPYARAATVIKFSRNPQSHAEAVFKYARTLVMVAEADHKGTRGQKTKDEKPGPYDTLVRQAVFAAQELSRFPDSPFTAKWRKLAEEYSLSEIVSGG